YGLRSVLPRIISSTGWIICCATLIGLSSLSRRSRIPSSTIVRIGCLTVVRETSDQEAISTSSKPTTQHFSGTGTPISHAPSSAPSASKSLTQKTASGGSLSSSSDRIAKRPPSCVNGTRRNKELSTVTPSLASTC